MSKIQCAKEGHYMSQEDLDKGICFRCRAQEKRRKELMKEKEEGKLKAPKTAGQDSYICPSCLEDSLFYQNDIRLFECINGSCKKVYALREMEYQDRLDFIRKEDKDA